MYSYKFISSAITFPTIGIQFAFQAIKKSNLEYIVSVGNSGYLLIARLCEVKNHNYSHE